MHINYEHGDWKLSSTDLHGKLLIFAVASSFDGPHPSFF
jgi:hypothetical protein